MSSTRPEVGERRITWSGERAELLEVIGGPEQEGGIKRFTEVRYKAEGRGDQGRVSWRTWNSWEKWK